MLRIISLFLIAMLPLGAFATIQAPDYLIYEGEKYPLHDMNPLEELFQEDEELRPKTEFISTGNWRGYIATFSIKNNELFLSDITTEKKDPNKKYGNINVSVIQEVFPDKSARKMDWYSGLFVIPLGDEVADAPSSCAFQCEQYLLIRISNGLVQEAAKMDLDEYMNYKTRQFEIYKAASDYDALYHELEKDNKSDEGFDSEEFIFQWGDFRYKIGIPFTSPNKSMQPTAGALAD